jgi:flagellar hook-basal body complex protein FliE
LADNQHERNQAANMFIVPINSNIINSVNPIGRSEDKQKAAGTAAGQEQAPAFKDFVMDMIQTVESTEAATQVDAYNLSVGNMDDTHTMLINAAKAELALQTMVQLRNKVMDVYTEIMRINI